LPRVSSAMIPRGALAASPSIPVGTILLPRLLLFLHSPFLFGYAKPVPVNYRALHNPRRDMVLVARFLESPHVWERAMPQIGATAMAAKPAPTFLRPPDLPSTVHRSTIGSPRREIGLAHVEHEPPHAQPAADMPVSGIDSAPWHSCSQWLQRFSVGPVWWNAMRPKVEATGPRKVTTGRRGRGQAGCDAGRPTEQPQSIVKTGPDPPWGVGVHWIGAVLLGGSKHSLCSIRT
jgi:hypothetical protein